MNNPTEAKGVTASITMTQKKNKGSERLLLYTSYFPIIQLNGFNNTEKHLWFLPQHDYLQLANWLKTVQVRLKVQQQQKSIITPTYKGEKKLNCN